MFQSYASFASDNSRTRLKAVLAGPERACTCEPPSMIWIFRKASRWTILFRDRYMQLAEECRLRRFGTSLGRRPKSAALIHPNNVRRVVRAFEMLAEDTTYAAQHERLQHLPQAVPAVFFGLGIDPAILFKAHRRPCRRHARSGTCRSSKISVTSRVSGGDHRSSGDRIQRDRFGARRINVVPKGRRSFAGGTTRRGATRSGSARGFERMQGSTGFQPTMETRHLWHARCFLS